MIIAFVAILLWAQALAPAKAHVLSCLLEESPGDDIDALCSGKPVNLTSFSQLQTLCHSASGCSTCADSLKEALAQLVKLIGYGKTDLCSVDSIVKLQHFYFKYLDTSDKQHKRKHNELLPKSLRQFVLAYGLQTSNLCKWNMAKVLTEQSANMLSVSDRELLEQLTGDRGPVSQVLGVLGGSSLGEIFMPGELAPLLKRQGIEAKDYAGDKLFVQTATGPYIQRLQSICERHYKPVYEPLMLPLVRLANMSFNYRDASLRRYLERPEVQQHVRSWSRIVFLCEVLANIEIVEGPAEVHKGQMVQVRVLTKEEAFAMKRANTILAPSDGSEAANEVHIAPSERVVLGDLIYDRANKRLRKLIRKFKTNWSVHKNIRKRMARKGLELAKDQLRQGHFKVVLSVAYKDLVRRHLRVTNPTELVVSSLDEMIQRVGTDVDDPTKSKMVSFQEALWDAFVLIIYISITVALLSSFFLGILL